MFEVEVCLTTFRRHKPMFPIAFPSWAQQVSCGQPLGGSFFFRRTLKIRYRLWIVRGRVILMKREKHSHSCMHCVNPLLTGGSHHKDTFEPERWADAASQQDVKKVQNTCFKTGRRWLCHPAVQNTTQQMAQFEDQVPEKALESWNLHLPSRYTRVCWQWCNSPPLKSQAVIEFPSSLWKVMRQQWKDVYKSATSTRWLRLCHLGL